MCQKVSSPKTLSMVSAMRQSANVLVAAVESKLSAFRLSYYAFSLVAMEAAQNYSVLVRNHSCRSRAMIAADFLLSLANYRSLARANEFVGCSRHRPRLLDRCARFALSALRVISFEAVFAAMLNLPPALQPLINTQIERRQHQSE